MTLIIKIDMKFLPVDSSESKSKKILTSVVRMAGWLKLPVVMEGVETKEQSDFLTSIGCEYIQGYYFARPMPVEEYEKLVKDVDQVEAVLNEDMLENNYANRIPHQCHLVNQFQIKIQWFSFRESHCFFSSKT